MEMVESVLVEEVGFVEEKYRMDTLGGAVLDVAAECVEQTAGGGRRGQPDGVTELTVEVATAERGIVAVREAEAGGRDAVAERAQDAGLADARLADEDDRGVVVERLDEQVDDDLLGCGEPEVAVGDFLREWRVFEREVREVGLRHVSPPRASDGGGDDRRAGRGARRVGRTARWRSARARAACGGSCMRRPDRRDEARSDGGRARRRAARCRSYRRRQ